ncbi:MAG: matrixin family metalloprotease [Planctomycetia bacterium]|nr:MAG: matrixin family metalloprotease [Planctomycetia bacterium]
MSASSAHDRNPSNRRPLHAPRSAAGSAATHAWAALAACAMVVSWSGMSDGSALHAASSTAAPTALSVNAPRDSAHVPRCAATCERARESSAAGISAPGGTITRPDELACAGSRAVGVSACFAPGTPIEQMNQALAAIPAAPGAAYAQYGRWSYTATNGVTGSAGTPITLTYSFPPDSNTGNPATSNVMHARFDALFGSREAWKNLFREIFDSWSAVSGIQYVEVPDDGAAWPGSIGAAGVRGDIRILCLPIDGPSGTLAYNYYPDVGDMVLDRDENWAAAANNYRFLRNIVLHENGHGLGLEHVLPRDGTKLMEAFLNTSFAGPQDDDIRGVNAYYGDRFESNNHSGTATELGAFAPGTVTTQLSLHAHTDVDWYAVSVTPGATLAFEAAPVGGSYPVSPDPGTPVTIDTRARMPLRVAVYRPDAVTLLAAGNADPGQTAVSSLISIPAGVTRVFARVSTSATTSDVQRYTLRQTQSGPSARRLALTSLPSGAQVTSSPMDNLGQTSVAAPNELAFNDGQTVTLTAATNVGTASFVRWTLDGIAQPDGQRNITLVMFGDRHAEALYAGTLTVSAGPDATIVAGESVRLFSAVSGGTIPYSYKWTPAAGVNNDRTAHPFASPTQTTGYTLTVTDAAGAAATDSVTVHVAPPLTADAGPNRFVRPGEPFSLTAAASGGEPPYLYSWSPTTGLGVTSGEQVNGLVNSTAVYTLTVRDAAGREAQDRVIVATTGELTATLIEEVTIRLGESTDVVPTVSGGDPPYLYEWSPALGTSALGAFANLAPRQTTLYTLRVTDAFGQEAVAQTRVVVIPRLSVAIGASQMTIEDGQSVTLSALVTGGAAPYAYRWDPAASLSAPEGPATLAMPRAPTAYTLTVSDSAGQSATATLTIHVTRTAGVIAAPGGLCGVGVLPAAALLLALGAGRRGVRRRR